MATDCDQGHDIKECPTNLDKSFDRKPPVNYKCNFCGKTGSHYGPLCPKHPDPNAIAHQRRKAYHRRNKAGLHNGERDRRDVRPDRNMRDASEEFSRLRLTPVWDRQGKRKASPSLSSDEGAPQKKNKTKRPIRGAEKRTVQPVTLAVDDLIARYRRREAPLATNDKPGEHVCGDSEHEMRPHSPSPRTPSPPPTSKVMEVGGVKQTERPIRGAKKGTVQPVTLGLDDLIVRYKRREAPLATNNKPDEHARGPSEHELRPYSLSSLTPSPPPTSKVVEVGGVKQAVSLKNEDAGCAIEDQLLELALAEMIQTESVKTDLLLFINGIEHLPPYHPSLFELFSGRESAWVNEVSRKTRPCPVDFFCVLDEEEKAETVDCEMAMEVETIKEEAPVWVLIDEEAADSSSGLVEQEEKQAENVDRGKMAVEEETLKDEEPACVLLDEGAADSAAVPRKPALAAAATEEDEDMADGEPATSADESGAGAIPVMLAAEPLQTAESLPAVTTGGDEEMADAKPAASADEFGAGAMSIIPATEILSTEESPFNEAKTEAVGAGTIDVPTAGESSADGVMQAATPGELVIEDEGGSEMAGATLSPVIESADDLDMAGAEPSPDGVVQEATSDEPVIKDARDSEMANIEPLPVEGSQIGLGAEPSATC